MIRTFQAVLRLLMPIAAFVLIPSLPAHAIIIPLTGQVTDAAPLNPFNVSVGDSVTGSTSFDESLVIADPNATLAPLDGITLEIMIGDVTFHETDDIGYPSFPSLIFSGGSLSNIDMIVLFDFVAGMVDPLGFTYSFDLLDGVFAIRDGATFDLIAAGTLSAIDEGTPGTVPEPSTIFLMMGGGLLGMVKLGRKRLMN